MKFDELKAEIMDDLKKLHDQREAEQIQKDIELKKEILSIKDTRKRQQAISENIRLFKNQIN